MASAATTLKFLLIAQDQASKTFKKVGDESEDQGKKTSKSSLATKAAILGIGVAAVGFAKSSISKFQQVTVESRGLQRAFGGTLQQASRLREASILSGVSSDVLTKSMQKLDKGLVAATLTSKSTAAMTKTLGMNFTDAHGKVLPMSTLLPKLADKFKDMPDGADKTALAMKLFGKAGVGMLPFLSKGSSGIADLEKQSDKFGTTLNNNAIDSLTKAKESSREWDASLDGLKVQLGAQLLPIMTAFASFIRDHIIPIIEMATKFISDHKNMMKILVAVVGTLIVAIKAWNIVQKILNSELFANPIGLVVVALVALGVGLVMAYKHSQTFRDIVKKAFADVRAAGLGIVHFFTRDIPNAFNAMLNGIRAAWNKTFAFIKKWGPLALVAVAPFIGIPLLIWQHFSQIKGFLSSVWSSVMSRLHSFVSSAVSAVGSIPGRIAGFAGRMLSAGAGLMRSFWHGITSLAGGAASFAGSAISNVASGIRSALDSVLHLPWTLPDIKIGAFGHYVHVGGETIFPALAKGTNYWGGGAAIVGDAGPEIVQMPRGSKVIPNNRIGSYKGGGDTVVNIIVPGAFMTDAALKRALVGALNEAGAQGIKLNANVIR